MTNTHLAKEIFKQAAEGKSPFEGMNETQLRDYQMWNMTELEEHLLETVNDQ